MDDSTLYLLGLGLAALLVGALGLFPPPRWNPLQLNKVLASQVSPGFAKAISRVMGAGGLVVGLVFTVVAVLMAVGGMK